MKPSAPAVVSPLRLAAVLGLALLSLTQVSCAIPLLYDYAGMEVDSRGPAIDADTGLVTGVRVDVRNIEELPEGYYVIAIPDGLIARHLEAANSAGGNVVPSHDLEVQWRSGKKQDDWLPLIFMDCRITKAPLRRLRNGHDATERFALKAIVKKDDERLVTVAIWVDPGRNRPWTHLGTAEMGHGTQWNGWRRTSWVLAPVALAADAVWAALWAFSMFAG